MSNTTRLPALTAAERDVVIIALLHAAQDYRGIAAMMRSEPPMPNVAKVFDGRAAEAQQLADAFERLEAAIAMEETA